MKYEVGLLVHGDHHFIVRGPLPNAATARLLAREWSSIQIARMMPELSARGIAINDARNGDKHDA